MRLNLVVRYHGPQFQPYARIRLAIVNAKVSDETFSVLDSAPGLNVLAGLKVFLASNFSILGEFKSVYTSFQFEDAAAFSGGIKGVYSAPAVVGGITWHFR